MFNPFTPRVIKSVSGPYVANSKKPRRYMMIFFEDGRRTGMSYARWLMTQHLQRRLGSDETVDHIDNDPMNDALSNLQILSMSDNVRKSATGRISPQRGVEKGFKHGTVYGWMKKKCSCEACASHRKQWGAARNERRRGKPLSKVAID